MNYFSFPKVHLKNILWHRQVIYWAQLLKTVKTTAYTLTSCSILELCIFYSFIHSFIVHFFLAQETFLCQHQTRGPLYWNTQSSNVYKYICVLVRIYEVIEIHFVFLRISWNIVWAIKNKRKLSLDKQVPLCFFPSTLVVYFFIFKLSWMAKM